MGDQIAGFYDDFLDRRMVGYRLRGNRRLQLANRFVRAHIRRDSNVLDVGCGIGITAEAVARKARRGRLWAFDLSARNVDYARRTVRAPNIEWRVLDVLQSPERLVDWVSSPVNVIVVIDVLEHIALPDQPRFMESLLSVAADDVVILLTFPSASYQQHLRAHDPGELQPVDEDITAAHLERLGHAHGLHLVSWNSHDVWLTDQYVHAVLRRRPVLVPTRRTLGSQAVHLVDAILRRVLGPLRRRRYGSERERG